MRKNKFKRKFKAFGQVNFSTVFPLHLPAHSVHPLFNNQPATIKSNSWLTYCSWLKTSNIIWTMVKVTLAIWIIVTMAETMLQTRRTWKKEQSVRVMISRWSLKNTYLNWKMSFNLFFGQLFFEQFFFKLSSSSPVPSVGNPMGGDDLQESLTQQLHQLQLQQQQNELLAQQAQLLRHNVDSDRNARVFAKP